MVFSSPEFVFLFAPVALCGALWLRRAGESRGFILWLIAASWFFYAYWNPSYLPILLASIGVNFGLGRLLISRGPSTTNCSPRSTRRGWSIWCSSFETRP